jgi:hypothetical protein
MLQEFQSKQEGCNPDARQAADDAMRVAMEFAFRWNASQMTVAGCSRLVKAWRTTLTVRRYIFCYDTLVSFHMPIRVSVIPPLEDAVF